MSLGNALAKRDESEESETVELVAAIAPESMESKDAENGIGANQASVQAVNDAKLPLGSVGSPKSSNNPTADKLESGVRIPPAASGNDRPTPGGPTGRIRSFAMSRNQRWKQGPKQSIEETLKVLRQSVKLNPDPPEAQCLLGKAYQRNGDYQQAVQFFEQGHQISKKNGGAADTEKMVKEAKALAVLGQQLHQLVSKTKASVKPDSKPSLRGSGQKIEQARTCLFYRRNASSACKLYASLAKDDTKVADELAHGHRLAAARTALFVSMSPDKLRFGKADVERIQTQAAAWLDTELDVLTKQLEANPKRKSHVAQVIKQLKADGWYKAHSKQPDTPANHPLNGIVERIKSVAQLLE